MAKGNQVVINVSDISWKTGENRFICQSETDVEITWLDSRKCIIEPFTSNSGHQGVRIKFRKG